MLYRTTQKQLQATLKEIRVYMTPEGKRPFFEWFSSIAREIRGDVRIRLLRVRDGNLGDIKPLGDGVTELRMHTGKGHRAYFGQDGNRLILLLTGGDKSSQTKDIKNAKAYWKDYKQRSHADQRPQTNEWTTNGHPNRN